MGTKKGTGRKWEVGERNVGGRKNGVGDRRMVWEAVGSMEAVWEGGAVEA